MRSLVLILFTLMLSCSSSKREIPQELLNEDTLVRLLKEIHLAEASFEINKKTNINIAKNNLNNNYLDLYKKYDTNEKQFEETLKYYSNYPEDLEIIYSKILKILNEEKTNLDQQ